MNGCVARIFVLHTNAHLYWFVKGNSTRCCNGLSPELSDFPQWKLISCSAPGHWVPARAHCSSDPCSNSTSSPRAQPRRVRFLFVWLILHVAGLVCAVNDTWLPWSQAVEASGTSSLVRHPEMSPDIDSGPQDRGMECPGAEPVPKSLRVFFIHREGGKTARGI